MNDLIASHRGHFTLEEVLINRSPVRSTRRATLRTSHIASTSPASCDNASFGDGKSAAGYCSRIAGADAPNSAVTAAS